jgi:hypothetical protein
MSLPVVKAELLDTVIHHYSRHDRSDALMDRLEAENPGLYDLVCEYVLMEKFEMVKGMLAMYFFLSEQADCDELNQQAEATVAA